MKNLFSQHFSYLLMHDKVPQAGALKNNNLNFSYSVIWAMLSWVVLLSHVVSAGLQISRWFLYSYIWCSKLQFFHQCSFLEELEADWSYFSRSVRPLQVANFGFLME